eukprot:Gb_00889 [translate_table: standard]
MGFDDNIQQRPSELHNAKGENKIYSSGKDNDYVLGFPRDNWGTDTMGDPANPCTNHQNKVAATWTAPQLRADPNVKGLGEPKSCHSDHKNRKFDPPVGVPGRPPVEACPYVLHDTIPSAGKSHVDALIGRMNKCSKKTEDLAEHWWSHMKLGPSMSEAVRGKLRLGAKIVTKGGLEKLFKEIFSVDPQEKLLKTSACYLSTTSGPVAGLLFISNQKLAFCSDQPLYFNSPSGGIARSYYRVGIPVGRVSSVNPCENASKPAEKYIQIQTVDNHEFWFMGFVNYHKAFKYLQQAVKPSG